MKYIILLRYHIKKITRRALFDIRAEYLIDIIYLVVDGRINEKQ